MKFLAKTTLLLALIPGITLTTICQDPDGAKATQTETTLPRIEHFDAGKKYKIIPKDLPRPFESESVRRSSRIVSQPENALLRMPRGFKISVFADGGF